MQMSRGCCLSGATMRMTRGRRSDASAGDSRRQSGLPKPGARDATVLCCCQPTAMMPMQETDDHGETGARPGETDGARTCEDAERVDAASRDVVSLMRRRQNMALVVTAVLAMAVAAAYLLYPRHAPNAADGDGTDGPPAQVLTGIDPNTANWPRLAQLPGIGETIARRIVEFRQDRQARRPEGDHGRRVFECAADLTQVHGIGEKTVRRMAPFLRFDSP